jgi:hypothetical protein
LIVSLSFPVFLVGLAPCILKHVFHPAASFIMLLFTILNVLEQIGQRTWFTKVTAVKVYLWNRSGCWSGPGNLFVGRTILGDRTNFVLLSV